MTVLHVRNFEDWRGKARALLLAGIAPARVRWVDGRAVQVQGVLGDDSAVLPPALDGREVTVTQAFMDVAQRAAWHRDADVWELLYGLAWRLAEGEKALMGDALDPMVRRVDRMRQQVARDIHKTHAFVRFRKVELEGAETYLAFHRPDHYVLRPASGFFRTRFASMNWGIATPDESVCWDGKALVFGEGMPAGVVPAEDAVEALWLTYYRHIFNPARIKTKMMKREMPVRHWATLPETALIPAMLAEAPERVEKMLRHALAAPSEGAVRRRLQQAAKRGEVKLELETQIKP
ncbi:MAG: DUF4130 domain-containing protein [Alphaproteobacteria bacterium]|nr:MAG: DUF4130 domain-containing protein [Alphaproteobacteria bacterium]